MITSADYIQTYGIAETWQLKPVNLANGDDGFPPLDLALEPWLVDAIARANAFVGLFINPLTIPLVFRQYALLVARYYLHFNNPSDTLTDAYSAAVSELGQLKVQFPPVSTDTESTCSSGFKITAPRNKFR